MLKKPQGFADEHLTDERICYSHIKVHNITLWATDFQKLLHYQHTSTGNILFSRIAKNSGTEVVSKSVNCIQFLISIWDYCNAVFSIPKFRKKVNFFQSENVKSRSSLGTAETNSFSLLCSLPGNTRRHKIGMTNPIFFVISYPLQVHYTWQVCRNTLIHLLMLTRYARVYCSCSLVRYG